MEELLRRVWGHDAFRPGQRQAIDAVLAGRDAVVLLPTGGGKSLCFQLPALRLGCAVVVSPLIALMQDQVGGLAARGVRAAALHSHQDFLENRAVAGRFLSGQLDLLYVSPERAVKASFERLLAQAPVGLLAIDEAHCISQWGHDFRPEYLRLAQLSRRLSAPTIALTATATPRVLDEIVASLALADPLMVRGEFWRPSLAFNVHPHATDGARLKHTADLLRRLGLGRRGDEGRVIVYCATRKKTEKVARALRDEGFAVAHYHAGRSERARATARESYERRRTPVMVATNAFGMGIDHPDVRAVVHFQTPGSVEAYYQEAGRAGRDGEPAVCELLFGLSDLVTQRTLNRKHRQRQVAHATLLAGIEAYARGDGCRQRHFVRYFTDREAPAACGACDQCRDPAAVRAAFLCADRAREQRRRPAPVESLSPAEVAIIVAAVGALTRPVGKTALAKALRGSQAKTLRRGGLLSLPQHGALRALNEASIVSAIEQLLAAGTLAPRGQKYPTVWLPDRPIRQRTGAKKTRRSASGLRRALESYRRREARRRKWKPYMVFQRKVIDAIEAERPASLWALEQIEGIGPAKLERFGEDLLDLVRRHASDDRA